MASLSSSRFCAARTLFLAASLAAAAALPCRAQSSSAVKRVLLFDQELGHGDVKQMLRAFLTGLAKEKGFDLDTADGATRNLMGYASLKNYQVVVWGSNEGGDPVLPEGELQNGFQRWVEEGGGYIAFHSGTGLGTLSWPWQFAAMIQPYRADQGQGISAKAFLYGPTAPEYAAYPLAPHAEALLKGLAEPNVLIDEWYSIVADPRKSIRLQVENPGNFQAKWGEPSYGLKTVWPLIWLDGDSWTRGAPVKPSNYIGRFHPVAWAHMTGLGATIQMTMGHQVNPGFFTQSNNFGKEFMWRSIRWAAKDCEYWKGSLPSCATAVDPIRLQAGEGRNHASAGPALGLEGLVLSLQGPGPHSVRIVDTRGRLAFEASGRGSDSYRLAEALSAAPGGIYFLTALAAGEAFSRKLIKR